MAEFSLHEVAAVTGGRLDGARGDMILSHFHFDTRKISAPGTLFFALRTQENDGHRFVSQLRGRENIAAVVEEDYAGTVNGMPLVRVKDPLQAAHDLARHLRDRFRHCRFVGITGSAGKTTTKEFVYQIVSHMNPAYRSHANWNNWIGLPFSLLQMNGDEGVAIFELAMSHPGIGEIDTLAEILRPDLAVILNVFPVHLEFLQTLDNVARGKSEILNYLAPDDAALVCGDSAALDKHLKQRQGQVVRFGRQEKSNHIILEKIERQNERTILSVRFFGLQDRFFTSIVSHTQLENLFAAIAAARLLGFKHFEIQQALENIRPVPQRGEIRSEDGLTVIDETYNSNPEALRRTLEWVDAEFPSPKIAVLGDMLELGKDEAKYHHEAGKRFAELGFDYLITVGVRAEAIAAGAREKGFKSDQIASCDDATAAGRALKQLVRKGTVILLKGSRGIRLEEVMKELRRA